MSHPSIGIVYGVGVGPGDPELITRKAERILAAVDWIFLPAAARNGASFVRRIVEPLGLPQEKFRPVSLCMSRDRAAAESAYRRAAAEIVAELRRGKSAAWITEGDPLFYSTFLHLYDELRGYPEARIEIVPGVTSVSAAGARAGLPAARLNEPRGDRPRGLRIGCRLPALLDEFATVFLLKVHVVFEELLTALRVRRHPIRRGLPGTHWRPCGSASSRTWNRCAGRRCRTFPW